MQRIKIVKVSIALICAAVLALGCAKSKPEQISISADVASKAALTDLIETFKGDTKSTSVFSCSFSSSEKIIKRIKEGANANIFIFAGQEWINEIKKDNLLELENEFVFKNKSPEEITFVAAAVKGKNIKDTKAFFDFLASDKAQALIKSKYGFK